MANIPVHRTGPQLLLLNYNAKCGLQLLLPLHYDLARVTFRKLRFRVSPSFSYLLSSTAWRTTPSPSQVYPRPSASWSALLSLDTMNLSCPGLSGVYHKISVPLALLLRVLPGFFPSSCDFSGVAKSRIRGVWTRWALSAPWKYHSKPASQAGLLRLSNISQDNSSFMPIIYTYKYILLGKLNYPKLLQGSPRIPVVQEHINSLLSWSIIWNFMLIYDNWFLLEASDRHSFSPNILYS